MRAIANTELNKLEMLSDLSKPEPGVGQVRIRTGAVGICATDLQVVGGWQRAPYPMILGHEWAGVVDTIGEGVDPSIIGKKCVGENVLNDGLEVGFEHPGGYAEFFITQADRLQFLPDDFSLATATVIEPLAVSVRGIHKLRGDVKGPVLIFGDGPIGLFMTLLLKQKGFDLVLVGGREYRLSIARDYGAETLNYHELGDNMAASIADKYGALFPIVVEASGSGAAMTAAMDRVAHEGRVLVIGEYGDSKSDFLWNDVLLKEMELIGSNASAGGWAEATLHAVEHHQELERVITHRLPAAEFAEGFRLMSDRSSGAVKVILDWDLS